MKRSGLMWGVVISVIIGASTLCNDIQADPLTDLIKEATTVAGAQTVVRTAPEQLAPNAKLALIGQLDREQRCRLIAHNFQAFFNPNVKHGKSYFATKIKLLCQTTRNDQETRTFCQQHQPFCALLQNNETSPRAFGNNLKAAYKNLPEQTRAAIKPTLDAVGKQSETLLGQLKLGQLIDRRLRS